MRIKKIFILAGEASGDYLASWYVGKLKTHAQGPIHFEGIGGDYMQREGVRLYKRFESLNVVGIIEILKHLPSLLRIMHELVDYIKQQKFEEVIVVDFPGFNLRLIRLLSLQIKDLSVTYLSPPQLWCWGVWRLKSLKRYANRIIVIYPFEVSWYAERGLSVEWLGSPVYEKLVSYCSNTYKKKMIALLPGSRVSEVEAFLPLFLLVAQILKKQHHEIHFVILRAQSQPKDFLDTIVRKHSLEHIWQSIEIIDDEHKKYEVLSQCCLALSKPGTVTLELGLLHVPAVVTFKASWLTYFLARLVVKVPFMSLPNLFLNQEIFKERIQRGCDVQTLAHDLDVLYSSFINKTEYYNNIVRELDALQAMFSKSE